MSAFDAERAGLLPTAGGGRQQPQQTSPTSPLLTRGSATATTPSQRAFWQAITVGDLETVRVLLGHRRREIDLNRIDTGEQRAGCTALHLAVLEMPTWRSPDGKVGIQTAEFIRRFFTTLLSNGANIDVACRYSGEWYLQTSAGKTRSFFPDGYDTLGLVLQFLEITRGAEAISSTVSKRLELIRDLLLEHIQSEVTLNTLLASNGSHLALLPWDDETDQPFPVVTLSPSSPAPSPSAAASSNTNTSSTSTAVSGTTTTTSTPVDNDDFVVSGPSGGISPPRTTKHRYTHVLMGQDSVMGDLGRAHALEKPYFSDVSLMCDDVKFPAHKFILCARSEVFAAMLLDQTFSESSSGVIKIESTNPGALKAFLRFLYTDNFDDAAGDDDDVLFDMLALSNRYQVRGLKLRCSLAVFNRLHVETAAKFLCLSDRHQALELKNAAVHFIAKNLDAVMATDDFKMLDRDLVQAVLETFAAGGGGAAPAPGSSLSSPSASFLRESVGSGVMRGMRRYGVASSGWQQESTTPGTHKRTRVAPPAPPPAGSEPSESDATG